MTTQLDLELPDLAAELIDEFGAVATLIENNSSYDPNTQTNSKTTINHTTKGIIGTTRQFYETDNAWKTVDAVYVANNGFEPKEGWQISIASKTLKIAKVEKYYSGELVALFGLVAER